MNLLLCLALCSDIVAITQSGCSTQGTVISISDRGTYILTCKHGFGDGCSRNQKDTWVAQRGSAMISGSRTTYDKQSDLSLLWTREKWRGKATQVAPFASGLPIVSVAHKSLPGGSDNFYMAIHHTKPGHSGLPLLEAGMITGVLWGGDIPGKGYRGRSYYTTHDHIVRFLKEQGVP